MPTRKVSVGALAGAVVTVGLWALSYFAHVSQPDYVGAAEVVIVGTALAYLIPEKDQAA
jgi:hypothetical protein